MIAMMQTAGFKACAATEFFDCFAGTTKENTARKYGVRGANFIAYKQ
ncbi:MAG: hypothetical protein U1A72_11990 [Sulfuritalea sp.]|nr:hypothetical protein [Sulfuritalea sp.]